MIGIQLSAVDTLHLRDPMAFAPTLTDPEHHSGQFPPHPPTVVGACRAWLARGQGWRSGPWREHLTAVLGDGHHAESLGLLEFGGPYLLCDGQPLFPMPAHVLGRKEHGGRWAATTLLRPAETTVLCDLGEVRLPEATDPRAKPGTGLWLTWAGLAAALRGDLPSAGMIKASNDLWSVEDRVGIERDDDRLMVLDRALYTSRHVRPRPGVAVGVRIDGVPESWRERCAPMMPLGGEGRLVQVDDWAPDLALDVPWQAIEVSRRVALVALTPVDYGPGSVLPGDVVIAQGRVTVVSACLPRAERVGGWASTGDRGAPVALRSMLPAGSTLFCEIADPVALHAAYEAAGGVPRIGQWQRWGFGAVGLGVWPAKKEVKQNEEER